MTPPPPTPPTTRTAAPRRRRARRGCRHHRHLPVVPRPRSRVHRAVGRGRRRRRAAPGTGTVTPVPASTRRATPTATSSPSELFDEWEWQEHFAPQPETERYLNHVVDRFGLRAHIRFGARVTSADYDEESGTVARRRRPAATDGPGALRRSRRPASSPCPTSPTSPDARRSVARRTTPASGRRQPGRLRRQAGGGRRHVVERCPGGPRHRRRGGLAHRVPAHAQLVHAAEQRADHPRGAGRAACRVRAAARGPQHLGPRLPPPGPRPYGAFEDSAEERQRLLREDVEQPGLHQADEQLPRPALQPRGERRVVRVHRRQDPRPRRTTRPRPTGSSRPITASARSARRSSPGTTRPSTGPTSRWSTCARRPMVRVTPSGIETTDGVREFDVIVWATGFDFGTGALSRMGIRGRDGVALVDYWADGPQTFLGVQTRGFPNLFFPGGPHAAAGQQPALQRRPGGLHHRPARATRVTTASTWSRSPRAPRSAGRG